MEGSKMMLGWTVFAFGVGIIFAARASPAVQQHTFKGTRYQQGAQYQQGSQYQQGTQHQQRTQYQQENDRGAQPLESVIVSEVEYVDGPLAPLYDFLIQRRLQRFCKLIRDAGVEQVIQDLGGSWTLFAPTDASFIFLPGGTLEELQRNPQLLRDFILYHFISEDFPSSQIQNEMMVNSVQGSPLRFNIYGQVITVSGAQVLEPDLLFDLGRVYIVDRPLYPIPSNDIVSYLQRNYRELYRLLVNAGLVDYISSGTFTLLAPDDEAFNFLSVELKDALVANRTLAERVLLTHILPGSLYVGGITDGMQVETVGGNVVTFTVKRGITFANDIPIVLPDVPLTNGVIHVINRVILPEGVENDCQCKPSADKPGSQSQGSSRPSFGQTQRPQYVQGPTTRRSGQTIPRTTSRPFGNQTPGVANIPRAGPQGPPSSPGQAINRPWNSPRTSQTVRQPSPSVRTTQPSYVPSVTESNIDDLNRVLEVEEQSISGQKRPELTRTTRYPPLPRGPTPTQRTLPQRITPQSTRSPQRGSYPGSEISEDYSGENVTPGVTLTTRQTDRSPNRPNSPVPLYPTPQRVSHRPPVTTRRPYTTRAYQWNQPRSTQPAAEYPNQVVGIDSTTLNPEVLQTHRPGVLTTNWQQRNQVIRTTRPPTQRPQRYPPPPAPQRRVTPPRSIQPSTPSPVDTPTPPFESNRQQPNCRRRDERITSTNRNLPICQESDPDSCQNLPYNPADSRPLCSQSIRPDCRDASEPYDPSDNRPQCPSVASEQNCREFGEPTYVGDRRPLCPQLPVSQTGCKDPSAPYNPSDRRPICRTTSASVTISPTTQGINTQQGCRRPDEVTGLQDQRPLCPQEPEQDCRPFLERPKPGDRRPVCSVNRQPHQKPKPTKDSDKDKKKPIKPQQQSTYSPREQYPTQTTRTQSWQTTTRPQQPSYPQRGQYSTPTTRRPSWQTTRTTQSWQTTTSARQLPGKQPYPGSSQTSSQPGSGSFPTQPQTGSFRPQTGSIPQSQSGSPISGSHPSPQSGSYPQQPQTGPQSSGPSQPQSGSQPAGPSQPLHPQTGPYPSRPQSGYQPSGASPQTGSQPSHPQSGAYPSQPHSGAQPTEPSQPQSGPYPFQPQSGSYPSRPHSGSQPAGPSPPQSGSYPSQPHSGAQPTGPSQPSYPQRGSYPSQPQSGSYPSRPHSGSQPSRPSQPDSGSQTSGPSQPQTGSYPTRPQSGSYPSRPQTGSQSSQPFQPQSGSYPSRPQAGTQTLQPHLGSHPSQPHTTQGQFQSSRTTSGYLQRRPGSHQSRFTTPTTRPQIHGVTQPASGDVRPGQPLVPQPRPGSGQGHQIGSFTPSTRPTTARIPISVTGTTTPGEDSRRTLYEIVEDPALLIRGRPVQLTKIFELFHKAGLEDILTEPGPTTVFLPSDDAFALLPQGVVEQLEENGEFLRQVLLYHVTKTEILPSSQGESYTIPSLEGTNLVITMLNGGKLILISGAKAVAVTRANNGIFYVINQLLYPLPHRDILGAIQSRPDLSTLAFLLPLSGLQDLLQGDTPYTLLAPTDNAFAQLPKAVYDELTRNTTALQEILLNHIIEGAHYGREFFTGGTFPSARGGKLKFQVVSYGYQVNEVNIKTPEIVTGTGVIHLIDQVLLEEPDLQFFINIENSFTGDDISITNTQQPGVSGQQTGLGQPIGSRPISGQRPQSGHQPATGPSHVGGLQPSVGQPATIGRIPSHGQRISGNQQTSSGQQVPGQTSGQTSFGSNRQTPPGQPQIPGSRQPSFQPGRQIPGHQTPSQQTPGQQSHGQQVPGQHIRGQHSPGQQTHGQLRPGQQPQGHSSFGGQRLPTNGQAGLPAGQRQPATQTGGQIFSGGYRGQETPQTGGQANDVAEMARTMGLNKFANWITNTGLLEKIHDGGVYTVFAPTDEAVSSLPQDMVYSIESNPDQVKPVLEYHIVPQRLNLNSVTNEETASTLLQGKAIRFNVYQSSQPDCKQLVTASGTPVGDALVTMGSIQVIPVTQVLYQPSGNLFKIMEASPILQKLSEAVKSASLTWMLSGNGPVTLFAPSDTAFESLTEDQRKALIENKQAFTDLLKHHIVRGTFFSNGVQDDIEKSSENNKPVKLSLQEGILTVNTVPVTYADITATNGVLHVIDSFL